MSHNINSSLKKWKKTAGEWVKGCEQTQVTFSNYRPEVELHLAGCRAELVKSICTCSLSGWTQWTKLRTRTRSLSPKTKCMLIWTFSAQVLKGPPKRHNECYWCYSIPWCIFDLKGIGYIFEKRSVNSNREEDVLHGESGWRTEAVAAAAVWLMKQVSHQDTFICWSLKGSVHGRLPFGPYVTWKLCLTHSLMDRDIHTNALKGRARNFKTVRFMISCRVSKLCLQTFDDKWPSTHLKRGILSKKCGNWLIFHKAIEQKEVSSWQDGGSNRTPSQGHLQLSPYLSLPPLTYTWTICRWAVGPCCKSSCSEARHITGSIDGDWYC